MSDVIPVSDENIINAEKLLLGKGEVFAEISSAIVIGAALQNRKKFKKNDNVCFIISGGNVDFISLSKILNKY